MKNNFMKKFLSIVTLLLVPITLNVTFGDVDFSKNHKLGEFSGSIDHGGTITDKKSFLGYGYDVAGGKPIYDIDALMYNNPILDVDNPIIREKAKIFDPSKTFYSSSVEKRATNFSKSYVKEMGIGANIGGQVSCVNVDVGAKFNKSGTSGWNKVANEEYSEHTIHTGNTVVALQMRNEEIMDVLNPSFLKDINNVHDAGSARSLLETYGTHLPTGYILGGLFEITNYYATNSDTYIKEDNTSLDLQVDAAISSAKAGAEFSFTEQYGFKNNNAQAVNSYKCSTFGGIAFPGLTLDQAFSRYQDAFHSGIIYDIWTTSINEGKNLVITGIPDKSKMIPLWDLLPIDLKYSKTRELLIEAYGEKTSTAYTNYFYGLKDNVTEAIDNTIKSKNDFTHNELGFTTSIDINGVKSSTYIDKDFLNPNEAFPIKYGTTIFMDYPDTEYIGQEAVWSTNVGPEFVKILDARNGVFEVIPNKDSINRPFSVSLTVNGVPVFTRKFVAKTNYFSGGNGTEKSPYLISTAEEFEYFASINGKEYWEPETYVKLTRDIDLTGKNISIIGGGDTSLDTNRYSGVFDGGYHTITNYKISEQSSKAQALFFCNYGTIKNLNVSFKNPMAPITVTNGTGMIAGIAAFNSSYGTIEKCSVDGMYLTYKNKPSASDPENKISNNLADIKNELYIGGIAGFNSGTITDCIFRNAIIDVDAYGAVNEIRLGGIAALAKNNPGSSAGIISRCEVEDVALNAYQDKGSKNNVIRVGGLIGHAIGNGLDINNCIVRNMKENVSSAPGKGAGYNIAAKATASGTYRYAAGLIAYIENDIKISNCIILDDISVFEPTVSNNSVGDALFIGHLERNNGNPVISNCYVERSNENHFIYNGNKTHSGITAKTVIDKPIFSSDITTSNVWGWDANSKPYLKINKVYNESLIFDSSKTKKTFYVGEEFISSNLSVTGSYTLDESEFKEKTLLVDSRQYNKNVPGTYRIFVSCYGVQFDYDVKVIEKEIDRIYAEEVEKITYTVGEETFNTDSIRVWKVLKSGEKVEIPSTEYTYTVPSNNLSKLNSKGYELGKNIVTISYGNFTCDFEVSAVEKKISRIEILDKQGLNKKYYINSNDNDFSSIFSNIDVKIYYEDQSSKVVKGSDCDFVYTKLTEGKNTISVSYDVTNVDTFIINGTFNISQEIIDEFIRLVNNINTNGTLPEQFKAINLAREQLSKIDSRYAGSVDYQAAKTALQTAIDDYNAKVDSINKGFKDTVEISESFNAQLATAAGLTTLAAIVGYVIKKHL